MNEASEERAISGHLIRIDRALCIGTGNCVARATAWPSGPMASSSFLPVDFLQTIPKQS